MPKKGEIRGVHGRWPTHETRRLQAVRPQDHEVRVQRWIAMSGLERGSEHPAFCNDNSGTFGEDYFSNQRSALELLADDGFEGFRIPFLWERMQPNLGGPLDPTGVQALRYMIATADRLGCKVILTMHNAGDYTMRINEVPVSCRLQESVNGQVRVETDHFVEFWSRMSHALCGLPNLHGFSLMSSADGIASDTWHASAQAAIDSIRQDRNPISIYVVGANQASTSEWSLDNADISPLEDPEGKVIYEAKCHLDHDDTGLYIRSFDDEAKEACLQERARSRLAPFVEWLDAHKISGAITDFRAPRDDQRWGSLLPAMIQSIGHANITSVCWSADTQAADDPEDPVQADDESGEQSSHTGLFRRKHRPA